MITRDQLYTLMLLRKRENNLFSTLPKDMVHEIYKALPSRNDPSSIALDLAADAREEAINKLLEILDKDPSLLLQAGNVTTRGGNTIIGVTPYEFLLGEGDPEFAAKIVPYFDEIADGEAERKRQYNRYKPHIDAMPNQVPDDLHSLVKLIIESSDEEVAAALNKKFDRDTELNKALKKFREKHAPRVINKPCMHYNYKTLELAFNLLDEKWGALSSNDKKYEKCRLVARQIIGFLQLVGLPAVDRFAFARASHDNKRSLDFTFGKGQFPDMVVGLSSFTGLGFDLYIFKMPHPFFPYSAGAASKLAGCFKLHVEQKHQTYRTYATSPQTGIPMSNLLK